MEKQILERGYITYCLTDDKGKFYNDKGEIINWEKEENRNKIFYWSEVYCEPDYLTVLIRKGKLLVKPTTEELEEKNRQSVINCRK